MRIEVPGDDDQRGLGQIRVLRAAFLKAMGKATAGTTGPSAPSARCQGVRELSSSDPTLSVLARNGARLRRMKRTLGLLLGAAVSIGALLIVLGSSGGIDELATALDEMSAGWVLAALLAMLAGYLMLALHLRRLASGAISLWRAVRADLLLFGLGNVLPGAPAPGAVLAAAQLRRDGLSARRVRFVLGFTVWFNVRTLLGIGALAFLVAFARQHPGVREAGLWWVGAIVVLLVLAATARLAARPTTARRTARALALLRRWQPTPPAEVTSRTADALHAEAKAVVGSPRNRGCARRASRRLLDRGRRVSAPVAGRRRRHRRRDIMLLAYVVGILISSLPLLPGGFGAVEAAIPEMLHHFGAPLDAALAGTLVYRAISALLPAAGGALLLSGTGLRRLPFRRTRNGEKPSRSP